MDASGKSTSGKIVRRLIPFLMLCYFVAYLDRVNVGLRCADDGRGSRSSPREMFGLRRGHLLRRLCPVRGAEQPAAGAIRGTGVDRAHHGHLGTRSPRGWRSSPVRSASTSMRFLLGVAEAGFFPGIILYLTYWFTAEERARWIGMFMTAIPLSSVIGGPLSGLDPGPDERRGCEVEGLAVAVPARGPALRRSVGSPASSISTTRPRTAALARPRGTRCSDQPPEAERHHREAVRTFTLREALLNPRVLALSLVYFGIVSGNYGLGYWLPTIVKGVAEATRPRRVHGHPPQHAHRHPRGGALYAGRDRHDLVDAQVRSHARAGLARRGPFDPRRRCAHRGRVSSTIRCSPPSR